jgi:hypothetical protein
VLSARSAAARVNGKLGGLKTASNHSPEFFEERSRKAGSSTRDKYGIDYYRFIRKNRKEKPDNITLLLNSKTPRTKLSTVEMMRAASKMIS